MKLPQNGDRYEWTNHVKGKMLRYRISESLIKRIIRSPQRVQEGVAEKTVAVMQPCGNKKHEAWVMYKTIGKKLRIISAWRYPGISPKGVPITIPQDALEALILS